jgi:hypothetical protein
MLLIVSAALFLAAMAITLTNGTLFLAGALCALASIIVQIHRRSGKQTTPSQSLFWLETVFVLVTASLLPLVIRISLA